MSGSRLPSRPLVRLDDVWPPPEGLRWLDVRSLSAWRDGHLPGAVRVDLEEDLARRASDPAEGGRHPLPPLSEWCERVGQWGIAPATDVVVYDDAGGANAAARAWWMLRAVGHERVAVLDGGLRAAREAGVALVAEESEWAPLGPYPLPVGEDWVLPRVTADELDELRTSPDQCVLDVRAPQRYRGESDPFDPNPGHVPGALNLPYAGNLGPDGRFRPRAELRAAFTGVLGSDTAEGAVVYCGSGVTACHTLLALEAAGLPGAALYVGSWSEWGRSERPKAVVLPS